MTAILPEFCAEWYRLEGRTELERKAYVASEIKRLVADGAPLLTAIIACSDGRTQQIALTLVKRNDDGEGGALFERRDGWRLRLVENGTPPALDPQGRKLDPKDAGKLVVKLGTLGGDLGPEADAVEVAQWGAEARAARAQRGRDLYRLGRVSRLGDIFPLEDAVTILKQWGVGIAPREVRRDGQLAWLVEEIPVARAAEDTPSTAKPGSKARAA